MGSEKHDKNLFGEINKFDVKTAILVDGAYYIKRAQHYTGIKSPKERANELERYCLDHLHDKYEKRYLYRIFYYDCPPFQKGENIYHPLISVRLIWAGQI